MSAATLSARELSAPWKLRDRIGLGFAWALGLLFCAITAAIVIFLLIQGLKYVTPSMFVTHPAAGFDETQTGGFLDPLIGTALVGTMAMAIAFPLGIAIGVWLSEFARPFGLARAVESTV
jgi:ABC-type phosphate transport system permease subunit